MANGTINVKVRVSDDGTLQLTKKSAKALRSEMQGMGRSAADVDRNLKGVSRQSANTTKNFSKMRQGLGTGLVPAYAILASQIFALGAAFRFLQDAADLRVLQEGQLAYAASTGVAMRTLAEDIIAATDAQIKFTDASQAAAIGTAAGLGSAQLIQLGKAAKDVSIVLGRDVTDSFNRLVRGVTKAEPELLDELGIILRLDTAMSEYKTSLGIVGRELTAFERSQAVANNVLTQAEQKYSAIIEASEISTNGINQFGKAFDDLINRFKVFLSAIEPVAVFLAKNPFAVLLTSLPLLNPIIAAIIPGLDELGKKFGNIGAGAVDSLKKSTAEIKESIGVIGQYKSASKGALQGTLDDSAKAAQRLTQGLEGNNKALKAIQRGDLSKLATSTISTTIKQVENLDRAFANLSSDQVKELTSALQDNQAASIAASNTMTRGFKTVAATARQSASIVASSFTAAFATIKAGALLLVRAVAFAFTTLLPILGAVLLIWQLLPDHIKEATRRILGFAEVVDEEYKKINDRFKSLNEELENFVINQQILAKTNVQGFSFDISTLQAIEDFNRGITLSKLREFKTQIEEIQLVAEQKASRKSFFERLQESFLDFFGMSSSFQPVELEGQLIDLKLGEFPGLKKTTENLEKFIDGRRKALIELGIAATEEGKNYLAALEDLKNGIEEIDIIRIGKLEEALKNLFPKIVPTPASFAAVGKFLQNISKVDLSLGLDTLANPNAELQVLQEQLKQAEETLKNRQEAFNKVQANQPGLMKSSLTDDQRIAAIAFAEAARKNVEETEGTIERLTEKIDDNSSEIRLFFERAVEGIKTLNLEGSSSAQEFLKAVQPLLDQDFENINIQAIIAAFDKLVNITSLAGESSRLAGDSIQRIGELSNSLVPSTKFTSALSALTTEYEVLNTLARDNKDFDEKRLELVTKQLAVVRDLALSELDRKIVNTDVTTSFIKAAGVAIETEKETIALLQQRRQILEKIEEQEASRLAAQQAADLARKDGSSRALIEEQQRALELSEAQTRQEKAKLAVLDREIKLTTALQKIELKGLKIKTEEANLELEKFNALAGLTTRQKTFQERTFNIKALQLDIKNNLMEQEKIDARREISTGRLGAHDKERLNALKSQELLLRDQIHLLEAQADIAVQLLDTLNQSFETGLQEGIKDLITNAEGSLTDSILNLGKKVGEALAETVSGQITDQIFGILKIDTAQQKQAKLLREAADYQAAKQLEALKMGGNHVEQSIRDGFASTGQASREIPSASSVVSEVVVPNIEKVTGSINKKEKDQGFFKTLFGRFSRETKNTTSSPDDNGIEKTVIQGGEGTGFLGGLENFKNGFLKGFEKIGNKDFLGGLGEIFSGFKSGFGKIFEGITSAFQNLFSGGLGDGGGGFASLLATGVSALFAANGGIIQGGFRKFENGGIVNKPTLGVIGEGKFNEAAVPLPDGKTIPVTLNGGMGGSNVEVNVMIENGQTVTQDVQSQNEEAKRLGKAISVAVQKELQNQRRPGGILSPLGSAR